MLNQETACTGKRNTLFSIYIPFKLSASDTSLSGKFITGPDGYRFQLSDKKDKFPNSFCFGRGTYPTEANWHEPLISFLASNKILLNLIGSFNRTGHLFLVHKIEQRLNEPDLLFQISDEPSNRKLSSVFFDRVIDQLRHHTGRNPGEEADNQTALYSMDELEAYFEICKHTLPVWVARAMCKNTAQAKFSDNKSHARAVLRSLANIDWSGTDVILPDYETAKKKLDETCFGLKEVKTRILQVIAQIRQSGKFPQRGILLVGPPGIGKTSIIETVAALFNLEVVRVNCSSVTTDPEYLFGSGRIYNNGKPGIIFQTMANSGKPSLLLFMDELDKSTKTNREGGTGTADMLLSVAGNKSFFENYVEEAIPTNSILKFATANSLSSISPALLDRFYVIEIPAYTSEEKATIWNKHVIPALLAENSIPSDLLLFEEDAIRELIRNYAIEPGVRDLEEYAELFVGDYCVARELNGCSYKHIYTKGELQRILGLRRRSNLTLTSHPGKISSYVCYSGVASRFLVEASITDGLGNLYVTGPIPDQQKDYVRVAFEYIKEIIDYDFRTKDVTVFVPYALSETPANHIGCAAFAAIVSEILGSEMDLVDEALTGGVDLNGTLYFDGTDFSPILRAAKEDHVKTIYAPVGVSKLIRADSASYDVTIIEAYSVRDLFSLVMNTVDLF